MKEHIVLAPKQVEHLFEAAWVVIDDWYFKMKKLIDVDDILNGNSSIIDEEHIEDARDSLGRSDCTKADVIKEYLKGEYPKRPLYKTLELLKGFKIKFTQKGDHHHDGQLVEYVIDLVSPNGSKTKLSTLMCLAVGFNVHDEAVIKV